MKRSLMCKQFVHFISTSQTCHFLHLILIMPGFLGKEVVQLSTAAFNTVREVSKTMQNSKANEESDST